MPSKFVIAKDTKLEINDWGRLGWLSNPPSTGAKQLTVIDVNLDPGKGHDFHKHPDQEGRRTRLKPSGGRYLFVYPMVKKRTWYRLPYEKRKAMMVEHFAIGHRYPQVKINTAYSFGLDDQEFMVAFESDEPAAFLDLVMELRESQASRYTERETPIFTCVLMAPSETLRLALGLNVPERDEARELQERVSLLAGG